MARPRYSDTQKKQMISTFVQAADAIVTEEGVDAVSIRRVAARAGYNSATLYNYFENLDHLMICVSMRRLKNTVPPPAARPVHKNPGEGFVAEWMAYCDIAFTQPQLYYSLMFGSHQRDLGAMIRGYYEVFPEDLDAAEPPVRELLLSGSFESRNLAFLLRTFQPVDCDKSAFPRINEIIVYYFKEMLSQLCAPKDAPTPADCRQRLEEVIRLVVPPECFKI